MPVPSRPHVPSRAKRIEQDLLTLVNWHERVLQILFTAVGAVLIAGVGIAWGLIPWFEQRAFICAAVVVSCAQFMATGFIGIGMVRAIVSRAASRFNKLFPRNSQDRPIALGILAGMTSPFHLAAKLQVALDVPVGLQAPAEDQVQAALAKLEPPPSVGHTSATATAAVPPHHSTLPGSSGQFIPLDVHHRPQSTRHAEGERDETLHVPLQPLERAEVAKTSDDERDL